jgi:hypothetical protein
LFATDNVEPKYGNILNFWKKKKTMLISGGQGCLDEHNNPFGSMSIALIDK